MELIGKDTPDTGQKNFWRPWRPRNYIPGNRNHNDHGYLHLKWGNDVDNNYVQFAGTNTQCF